MYIYQSRIVSILHSIQISEYSYYHTFAMFTTNEGVRAIT